MHNYYAPDLIFRMTSGIGQGNEHVIAATLATLAEFPDRELLAEDVIWSGTPEDGMLSSHRLFCQATHSCYGLFGTPSGKFIQFRAIADCHAKNNRIDDEWLIRDHSAICKQPGFEPREFARHLESIMNADISVIRSEYDRPCAAHHPGGVSVRGYAATEIFWLGLRAAFPSAEFTIDHQIGRADEGLGVRAAIRWSLNGKHDGWGTYGNPTGADVYIMGFTHADFGPWGLRSEYTLIDEVAIRQQIHGHTG